MRFDEESQILALRHVYCYLRLGGVASGAALDQVRAGLESVSPLARGAAAVPTTEALLQEVLRAQLLPAPEPTPPPPICRGHVHCP